jgi:hypothetical protein
MIARQQRLDLAVGEHRGHELRRHLSIQQPVAVLREHRRIPHRIIDAEPHEPAVHEVVVKLLRQLPLGAHREECLQQRGAQQLLRRDRGAPLGRVELAKIPIEAGERIVHDLPDLA